LREKGFKCDIRKERMVKTIEKSERAADSDRKRGRRVHEVRKSG
jgi:hypothetical protein